MPTPNGQKNVFILGLNDFQLSELKTIRDVEMYAFHGLLDYDTVVRPKAYYSFNALLEQARRELEAFSGSVDAIIPHWDFPTSVLAPVLCKEYGIPAPALESVFKCEHKYWSRIEQQKAIPLCIPRFNRFDPFDDRALDDIGISYPFWIKPVKSFSSQLGFRIYHNDDFLQAIDRIRNGIGRIGKAFDEALKLTSMPDEIRASTGNSCIAEEIIHGVQAAPEGSMFRGEFNVHGIFDMEKDSTGRSFDRLTYPSALPEQVQQRMINACEQFLRHIGFDNGCFNAEFMWDQQRDKLQLIEVNPRISQSHSDLFTKVDGMSNHAVAINVARGLRPAMPFREGRFRIAAKCLIPHQEDAIISRVPDEEELRLIRQRFPDTHVRLDVEPGMRLSETPDQDSYRYALGAIYIGAEDRDQLLQIYEDCLAALKFEFQPVPPPPPGHVLTRGMESHTGTA